MGLSRPTATKIWPGAAAATSTGTSSVIEFGLPVTKVGLLISNASTKAFAGTLQGSLGASTSWNVLHTFTTAATTGASARVTTTGNFVVDKARIVLTGNDPTGTLLKIWAGGALG